MTGHTNTNGRGTPRLRRDGGSDGWDNLPPAPPPPSGEEFDALTDLFLGEVGSGDGAVSVEPSTPAAQSGNTPRSGRPQPVLRLAGIEEELDLDDAPAQVTAKVDTNSTSVRAESRTPATAAGTSGRDGGKAAIAEMNAIVECIVLGHLPVLAAAWGAQYVREVAQASGRPVAYLRLQHGYASIELIGGDGSSEALPSAKTIEEGIRLAAERTQRWIVRADAGDEARLAASPLVRVITLLTGVDEAAVVAAYSSVKALAGTLSAAGTEATGPMMRVAAMGAAADKALPAAKRLADAITRFVGREVDTAVCSARISSARPSEVLFTGRTEIAPGAAMELLAKIADETEVVERPVRASVQMPARPTLVRAPEPVRPTTSIADLELDPEIEEELDRVLGNGSQTVAQLPAPVVEQKPEPVFVAAASKAAAEPAFTPPPREPTKFVAAEAKLTAARIVREAAPVVETDPDAERSEVLADAPSALALLLPGLRPVSIRCPYAEGIEFALDRSGTVHLLSRIEVADAASASAGEERALSQLLVAGAWADAHASMLAASLGQSAAMVASGMSARAELHLFTDRPKASRRLLETSVNVHLLARVEVAGQSGWYCTDLN